jgi:hypothetical protein
MKYEPKNVKRFAAVKKYRDGGECVEGYFETRNEAEEWIRRQKQPNKDEFVWMVGEW